MKKNLKLTMALFIALILVVNVFMPAMKVFANDGDIIFDGADNIYDNKATYEVTLGGKDLTIKMWAQDGDNKVAINAQGNGHVDSFANVKLYADITDGTIPPIDFGGKVGIDFAGTQVTFTSTKQQVGEGENEYVYHYELTLPNGITQLMIDKQHSFFYNNQPAPAGLEDIDFDIDFSGVMMNVSIPAANKTVMGGGTDKFVGKIEGAGTTNPDETNTLEFSIEVGESKVVSEFDINGTIYKEGDGRVVKTMDNLFHTPIYTITVPGAEKYTIRNAGSTDVVAARTIIWANPGATDIDSEDALIEHGSARIIAVYDKDGALVSKNKYTHEGQEYGLDDKNNGWAKIDPGFKVVFEFVPEYGYQLTKVAANEQELAPQSTTNQYTFTMPDTNVHFAATFTKTEDIVKAESEKVSSGEISLGNTLDGGTAQLTVNDVELSSDKITGFENAAGDYTISNYLDIDLYNVFYKGKADSNDVWSNKIDELDKEATITLKLAEGVNAEDIVIVHNIHDGDEYEVIQIDSYDAETNTITFKTKSFSNYAIATKASATTDTKSSSNPKTGDIIAAFIAIFAVSTVGFIVTKSAKKRV